jgi:hypothetical protein
MGRVSTQKVSKLLCVCVCVRACVSGREREREREREIFSIKMGTWPRHFYFAPRKNRGLWYVFMGRRYWRCCNPHTLCSVCGQCWFSKKCVGVDRKVKETLEEVRLMPSAWDVPQDQQRWETGEIQGCVSGVRKGRYRRNCIRIKWQSRVKVLSRLQQPWYWRGAQTVRALIWTSAPVTGIVITSKVRTHCAASSQLMRLWYIIT